MSIDLTGYERGDQFSGDVDAALEPLRERLARAQLSQIANRQRAVLVLEGREGAGKAAMLRHLWGSLDPRFLSVCTVMPDRRRRAEGHWLARFWAALPDAGRTTAYFHSWYGRVLEDRVLGLVAEKDWRRAYDEINEFEAQQRDYGTLVVKLFMHATDAVAERRINEQASDPWRKMMLGLPELREARAMAEYRAAVEQMLAQNHTRWSPWIVIDSNDDQSGLVAGFTAVTEALEKAVPAAAPAAVPEASALALGTRA